MQLTDEQIDAIFDIIDWIQDENGASRREALEEVMCFLQCGIESQEAEALAAYSGVNCPTISD